MERSNESIVAGLGTPLADVSPVMVDDSTAARPQSDRELDVVYIELDTLLDTRIGTISQHRPELAPKLLNSGKYSQRIIDRAFLGLGLHQPVALAGGHGGASGKEEEGISVSRSVQMASSGTSQACAPTASMRWASKP